MLGTIHDAEDASQEILIKVMTHLSGIRGDGEDIVNDAGQGLHAGNGAGR